MDGQSLVELAVKMLECSQKELALRLGVSPTQVSKWKKGEHMSHEMEEKLRGLVNIGDRQPSFVLWAGSFEEAKKWERLIRFLADEAIEEAETGFDTVPLQDELSLLSWHTFYVLREMGVELPNTFPSELDVDYESDIDDENFSELCSLLEANPYSALISEIYASLNNVYGFYAAYIDDLMFDDDLDLMGTPAENIEPCLLELAACKIEVDEAFATNFKQFRYRILRDYEGWLNIVKDTAFRAGAPLRAELLGLVHDSDEELRDEAEAESLGLNSSRIHPDIYMNELLCGMRVIHQVLPAIMEKLGIDDFQLDTSSLQIR